MGGGGLRILGHKKWHVWRRENLKRVERDERGHAEKTRSLRDEQTRREQELRTQVLDQTSQEREEHINFFREEEEAHTLALLEGGDDERAKKNAAARGSETLGHQAQLPWYAHSGEKRDTDRRTEGVEDTRQDRKRKRALEQQDPLLGMRPRRDADDEEDEQEEDERVRRRHAKRQREKDLEKKRSYDKQVKGSLDGSDSDASDTRRRRRDAKKKHRKSNRKEDASSREQLLVQLRHEREEREVVERERTERLMRGQ